MKSTPHRIVMLGAGSPGFRAALDGAEFVITAGINHMNWMVDIRVRGTGESCLDDYLQAYAEDLPMFTA